jgi:hypothetical protein
MGVWAPEIFTLSTKASSPKLIRTLQQTKNSPSPPFWRPSIYQTNPFGLLLIMDQGLSSSPHLADQERSRPKHNLPNPLWQHPINGQAPGVQSDSPFMATLSWQLLRIRYRVCQCSWWPWSAQYCFDCQGVSGKGEAGMATTRAGTAMAFERGKGITIRPAPSRWRRFRGEGQGAPGGGPGGSRWHNGVWGSVGKSSRRLILGFRGIGVLGHVDVGTGDGGRTVLTFAFAKPSRRRSRPLAATAPRTRSYTVVARATSRPTTASTVARRVRAQPEIVTGCIWIRDYAGAWIWGESPRTRTGRSPTSSTLWVRKVSWWRRVHLLLVLLVRGAEEARQRGAELKEE